MAIVELGWLQNALDYLYANLLTPLFEWLTYILGEGLTVLASALGYVMETVMNTFVGDILKIVADAFMFSLYKWMAMFLFILDCIENSFNIATGLSDVYMEGRSKGMSLLTAVYSINIVRNVMLTMIVIGFFLCLFFAILATIRSMLELGGGKSRPVTHVLRMTGQSLLYLILAPAVGMFFILMSGAILNTIDGAMTQDRDKTSMARIIFCISSLDALDTDLDWVQAEGGEAFNISYKGAGGSRAGIDDKFRKPFYKADPDAALPLYMDFIEVRKSFTFRGIDYIIGIGGALFFIVVLCMTLFVFISRIFDVVLLLAVEPLFISVMPLDDGNHFRKWLELFLGKLFGGFGAIIAMRIYLMVVEQLFNGKIRFSSGTSSLASLQDYLIALVFAAGGALAVKNMGPLITGLISQAGARGEEVSSAVGGAIGSTIAFGGLRAMESTATSVAGSLGGMAAKMGQSGGSSGGGNHFGGSRKGGSVGGETSPFLSPEERSLNRVRESSLGSLQQDEGPKPLLKDSGDAYVRRGALSLEDPGDPGGRQSGGGQQALSGRRRSASVGAKPGSYDFGGGKGDGKRSMSDLLQENSGNAGSGGDPLFQEDPLNNAFIDFGNEDGDSDDQAF